MPFYADLHIHSKYSRACSRDCDLEHLAWWARRKGVTVVGSGDFTHPAWFEHLREKLDRGVERTLPVSCRGLVRFMLSVEISTIYKRAERTRKVHHLVYVPDLEAAERFNRRLGRIGNIASDGRPILGLDSRDLLEITLESGPGSYLVPAHAWTPWFAVLGSKSGFDAVDDCYLDLADHIFALETGLSSDPAMNWRVSSLDRFRLVSNSDAHSPPMLGREACVFSSEMDYFSMRRALETGEGYGGTVEFFPEEGKYHLDGHRKCDVCMEPTETRRRQGRCPVCGKPLTVGVLHRVEELADRPEGARLEGAAGFRNLIQLPEIVGETLRVGPKSKAVAAQIDALTERLGPELGILTTAPLDEVARVGSSLLAEALGRLREGRVLREAGYDGEYGVIRLFERGELERPASTAVLFEPPPQVAATPKARRAWPAAEDASAVPAPPPAPAPTPETPTTGQGGSLPPPAALEPQPGQAEGGASRGERSSPLDHLDPDQRAAAAGTGKTRALTHRIAHLVAERGVPPGRCLAITFTRRAAEELRQRLGALLGERAGGVTVATFHSLGLAIVREQRAALGLGPGVRVADEVERLGILREVSGASEAQARRLAAEISRRKRVRAARDPGAAPAPTAEVDDLLDHYDKALRERDLVDFDDLIALPVTLLGGDHELAARYRDRWGWISVDEYQDVDELQYRLLRLLTTPDGNLCAIGDPDQAIYGFRGADVGFFLRFRQDFPGAATAQLTRNYRSSAAIVDGAVQAIAPGTLVRGRVLRACASTGRPARPPRPSSWCTPSSGCWVAPPSSRSTAGGSTATAGPTCRSRTWPCSTAPTRSPPPWWRRCPERGCPSRSAPTTASPTCPACRRCCGRSAERRPRAPRWPAPRRRRRWTGPCWPASAGPRARPGSSKSRSTRCWPWRPAAATTWTGSSARWRSARRWTHGTRARTASRCSPCTRPRGWSSRWCSWSAARTACCRCGSARWSRRPPSSRRSGGCCSWA